MPSSLGWRSSPALLLPTCNLLSKFYTENPGSSRLCLTPSSQRQLLIYSSENKNVRLSVGPGYQLHETVFPVRGKVRSGGRRKEPEGFCSVFNLQLCRMFLDTASLFLTMFCSVLDSRSAAMGTRSDEVMVRTVGGSSHFWTRKRGTNLRVQTSSTVAHAVVAQGWCGGSVYVSVWRGYHLQLFNQMPT